MAETPGERTIKSLEQAVDYATGRPSEGTRESWRDAKSGEWRSRTFLNGKWINNWTENDK